MIILVLAFLIVFVCVAFLILALGPQDFWRGTKEFISVCIAKGIHWILLIILAGIVLLAVSIPILENVIPPILFFFGRLGTYLSLWWICVRRRYSFRICRAPFRSLKGIDENPDIRITLPDMTFFLHFADMPLSLTKVLVLLNDHEYRIYSTTAGKLNREGGGSPGANMSGQRLRIFRGGERELNNQVYHVFELPTFPNRNPEYHFLVVSPAHAKAKYMNGKQMLDISAEIPVGNLIACRIKTMKKRLRGELYAPLDK